VTTQACKDVIGIISQYIHPFKAQFIVEQYCMKRNLPFNDFSNNEVPNFILFLANERDSIDSIDDVKFFKLLSTLVTLSNAENS
jgi:hypothetical protein